MSCDKADARPKEDPAAGGGGVDQIATILRQRPYIPNDRDELVLEAKEEGSMVVMCQREGEKRKQKIRKPTDKYSAAQRG